MLAASQQRLMAPARPWSSIPAARRGVFSGSGIMGWMNVVGAGAAQKSGFEMGLPQEAQLAILLLSLACAAWLLSLALPPPARWREAVAGAVRRCAARRRPRAGVSG